MKSIFKKTAIFAIAGMTVFASCKKDDNTGGIGNNPKIPSWAQSAPANKEALAATWNANPEFSNVEAVTYGGIDYVDAIRTASNKVYDVDAVNYGTPAAAAQQFQMMKSGYDAMIAHGGEAALEQALKEEGITNFNWNDTGISYTQDGYECFWKATGSWWFSQTPQNYY